MSRISHTPLRSVLVLGAGKVGGTIADMVAEAHQIPVTLADQQLPTPGGGVVAVKTLTHLDPGRLPLEPGLQNLGERLVEDFGHGRLIVH